MTTELIGGICVAFCLALAGCVVLYVAYSRYFDDRQRWDAVGAIGWLAFLLFGLFYTTQNALREAKAESRGQMKTATTIAAKVDEISDREPNVVYVDAEPSVDRDARIVKRVNDLIRREAKRAGGLSSVGPRNRGTRGAAGAKESAVNSTRTASRSEGE